MPLRSTSRCLPDSSPRHESVSGPAGSLSQQVRRIPEDADTPPPTVPQPIRPMFKSGLVTMSIPDFTAVRACENGTGTSHGAILQAFLASPARSQSLFSQPHFGPGFVNESVFSRFVRRKDRTGKGFAPARTSIGNRFQQASVAESLQTDIRGASVSRTEKVHRRMRSSQTFCCSNVERT